MAAQQIFSTKYTEELRRGVEKNIDLYRSNRFDYSQSGVYFNNEIVKPESLELKLPDENGTYDAENAERLYLAYKHLTPLQASDTRLWTYLAHIELYEYVIARWSDVRDSKTKDEAGYIRRYWFINSATQANLLRHSISSMWWAAHLSYDESQEDPFELTKILYRQLDFATRTLGTYNLARYKPAVHGILGFIKSNPELFSRHFQDRQRFITKYLNQLGGVRPLTYFNQNFFVDALESVRDRIEAV